MKKLILRNIHILFHLTALLICASPNAHAKMGSTVPDFNEIIDQQEEDISTEAFIDRVLKKIENEPFNHVNYNILAYLFDEIGEYSAELGAMEKAVCYLPDDSEEKEVYYGNYARAFFLNDQWEKGKGWLDLADEINPDSFYNRWNAYEYYFTYKKDDLAALKELKRLNEMADKDKDPYYDAYLKIIERESGKKGAVNFFKKAVKQEPYNHKTHRALAAAIRNSAESEDEYLRNMPAVLKELKKALKLDPTYIPTYMTLGNTYYLLASFTGEEKHYKAAFKWFNQGMEVNSKDLRLVYAMGNVYYHMGRYDEAIEKMKLVYDSGLQGGQVIIALAKAYNGKAYGFYESGENLEEGLKLVDKAIELIPESSMFISTKAELLYKLGRYEDAYKYIKQAITLGPIGDEMRYDLNVIEAALGKQGEFKNENLNVTPEFMDSVRMIEETLKQKGYDPGEVDGIMDMAFRTALGSFQKDNNLKVTKYVDGATRQMFKIEE